MSLSEHSTRRRKIRKAVPGVARDDSDDELGDCDHPWEWIFEEKRFPEQINHHGTTSKRKKIHTENSMIIGARMGDFECYLGDTVFLKAEGSNEAWVGLICEFDQREGEDDDKWANFMWFSTEREVRNKEKKRLDFLGNELYISPSWDYNPLASINGSAQVMSLAAFRKRYPNGRVPRNSKDYGKVFVCRRGCNTRTASYTEEFMWEDIYDGTVQSIYHLIELVKNGTKATRRRRQARESSADPYVFDMDDNDVAERLHTPKKKTKASNLSTPTSNRTRTTPKLITPSHRKVMVKRLLEFTPLATRTLASNQCQYSPFQQARAQLHVASVPASLPCRESEFSLVYSHLEAAITEGTGSCIYISGTPGTGKTATVREVVSQLDLAVQQDELDDFIFVEINGMKMTEPHQAYALLFEALKGQRVSPGQALDLLEHEFNNPSPRRVPCVVLMDELDQLVTKNQGVMYNFFNWPGLRHSRLIVLAVANTMDLPERTLSNKISSRLGLTRITFPGYNHEQLMKIIQSRLEGVPGTIVDADAIQFASRKVAAVSGDARRALDICRRAVEIAEEENRQQMSTGLASVQNNTAALQVAAAVENKKKNPSGRVTIDTVRRAIAEATSSPLQQYLRALPFAYRYFLSALLARTQRIGVAESTFGDVLEETQRSLQLATTLARGSAEGRPLVALLKGIGLTIDPHHAARKQVSVPTLTCMRLTGLGKAATELAGAGLIYLEGHKVERPSKIRLAIGDEDVRLALRDDPEVKALGLFV